MPLASVTHSCYTEGMTDQPNPLPANDQANGDATTGNSGSHSQATATGNTIANDASQHIAHPLPHNTEAEQDLLGALLADNTIFESIIDHLEESHFHTPLNGRIFAASRKLHSKGQPANPVTLKSYFAGDPTYQAIDIDTYLRELIEHVTSLTDAPHYAIDIYQCYLRRQLILIADSTISRSRTALIETSAEELIEETEQQLFALAEHGQMTSGLLPFDKVLEKNMQSIEAAYKSEGNLRGLGTGLTDLNKQLGGLQASDLIIVAGRPGMGKTAFATNIAFHIATTTLTDETAQYIAFFSLEMSAEQLANRIVSSVARIPSNELREGRIKANQFNDVVKASKSIATAPFYIDDTPSLSVSQLAARARRLKRKYQLGLIVVDYLQLLASPLGARPENRVHEISAISRALKAIAKELNIPVLAISQLSRAVEQRENKQPELSDLRESGSIEQDADVVLFLYREEYYLNNSQPKQKDDESEDKFGERYERWKARLDKVRGKAEATIAKQRHGPTGKVHLNFNDQFTEFSDLAHDDYVPDYDR